TQPTHAADCHGNVDCLMQLAARHGEHGDATAAETNASSTEASGSAATRPSAADVARAVQAVAPAVRACANRPIATPAVTPPAPPHAARSGRATPAVVDRPYAGTPVGSCIAVAMRHARGPAFTDASYEATVPAPID